MWLLAWGLHGPAGKPHSSWSKLFATNPKCRLAETEYTPAGFKWIRSQMRIQAGLMVLGLDAMRGFGKAIGFVADLQMLCWLNRCSSDFFCSSRCNVCLFIKKTGWLTSLFFFGQRTHHTNYIKLHSNWRVFLASRSSLWGWSSVGFCSWREIGS